MKRKLTVASAFVAVLCFVNLQTLQAQDTSRTITLKEAVDLSITNSHLLKNNKAKITEATAAIQEAKERLLPDVNVSGAYMYLPTTPNIHMASDTSGKGFGGPKISQVVYGSLNASLPLYTGGKLKYGIESAKYLQEAAKLDAADNKEAVIINTVNAYSNLYKSLKAVTLVKENLEQSNQRVKDFTNLEQNGLIARNDLLKVKLQSSNIELTLLDAQSNYKIASVNMALMLGLPEQTMLVADSASLQQPGDVKSIEAYEQLALQSRNDISALALRKKSAELGIKSVKADYYPNIALTTGYIAADIPKFLSVTNAVTVGLGVKYSLSSYGKQNQR
jgi:outer membrane protein TolC